MIQFLALYFIFHCMSLHSPFTCIVCIAELCADFVPENWQQIYCVRIQQTVKMLFNNA